MSYQKLPVSSLETKSSRGDTAAHDELKARAKAGLRRATLALERLAKTNRPNKYGQNCYPTNAERKQTNRPMDPCDPCGQDSHEQLATIDDYKRHNRQLAQGINPLDSKLIETIEREEFARYGNLTAQQIYNKEKGYNDR